MSSAKNIRRNFIIKDILHHTLFPIRGKLIFLLALYLLMMVVGIFITQPFMSEFTIERLNLVGVLPFIASNSSFWAMFLLKTVMILLLSLFTIFFAKNTFVITLCHITVIVLGYFLGYNIIIVFSTFSFLAIVLFVIFYPLMEIVIMFLYFIILATCINKTQQIKKYGKICASQMDEGNRNVFLITLLAIVLAGLIQCILVIPLKYTMIISL